MANNRWGTALRGGIGAAGTGLGLAALATPGIGWAAGIGLGASALYDAFTGKSAADERSDRINQLIAKRQAARQEALKRLSTETTTQLGNINRQTTGRIQQGASAIGRRAASAGRSADEADFLSSQNAIANQGSQNTQALMDASLRASNAINSDYDRMIADAETEQASLPIEPSLTDYIGELGSAGMQYAQNQGLLKAMSTRSPGMDTTNYPGFTGSFTPPKPFEFNPNIPLGRNPNPDLSLGTLPLEGSIGEVTPVAPVANVTIDGGDFTPYPIRRRIATPPYDPNSVVPDYSEPRTVPYGRRPFWRN